MFVSPRRTCNRSQTRGRRVNTPGSWAFGVLRVTAWLHGLDVAWRGGRQAGFLACCQGRLREDLASRPVSRIVGDPMGADRSAGEARGG